jgi:hypothetical protein
MGKQSRQSQQQTDTQRKNAANDGGRLLMLITVLACFVISIMVVLYNSRGGRADEEEIKDACKQLGQIFIPFLTIMGGFKVAEHNISKTSPVQSSNAALYSLLILSLWSIAPIAILLWSDTLPQAIRFIRELSTILQGLAAGAIAFYFSKTATGNRKT